MAAGRNDWRVSILCGLVESVAIGVTWWLGEDGVSEGEERSLESFGWLVVVEASMYLPCGARVHSLG